jgi:hypothetical protein
MAGIWLQPVDVVTAGVVLVDQEGKLGTEQSSRRYKEGITELGEVSSRLLDLRPVAFRFKEESKDGSRPVQFGLIAEEVAEVFPELVVSDENGKPFTVKYHLLSSLLLNELQKQHRKVEVLSWLVGTMLVGGVALTVGRWRFG